MDEDLFHDLKGQMLKEVALQQSKSIALIGLSEVAFKLRASIAVAGLEASFAGIFDPFGSSEPIPAFVEEWAELIKVKPELIIICGDETKEDLLIATVEAYSDAGIDAFPKVLLGGAGHLAFRDEIFAELTAPAMVPSYATGYPNTIIHMYQCLKSLADNNRSGAIVELGAFKGGTIALLARMSERLGLNSTEIIGMDSWGGFPPRRSLLDLYEHPRCVFTDFEAVERYVEPFGVRLLPGDISDTCEQLRGKPIALAFCDTDNYSPARHALALIAEQLIVGGAIVLDHFTTTPDYVYTVGERMAAKETLCEDATLLNLHETGVFLKVA